MPDVQEGRPVLTFAAILTSAMARAGMSNTELAGILGAHRSAIAKWRAGSNIPMHDSAIRLAELLDEPRLASISYERRDGRCIVCDKPMFAGGKRADISYCSESCRRVEHIRRVRVRDGVQRARDLTVMRNRLTVLQDAVVAFCHSCTQGDGVCPDAGCDLRPASPLPLAKGKRER